MELWADILAFLRSGFNQVNALQGLLIALVAGLMTPRWSRLPVFAFAAVLVHLLVDMIAPVMTTASALRLPAILDAAFWRYAAALFVGYLIVISLVMLARRLLMRR